MARMIILAAAGLSHLSLKGSALILPFQGEVSAARLTEGGRTGLWKKVGADPTRPCGPPSPEREGSERALPYAIALLAAAAFAGLLVAQPAFAQGRAAPASDLASCGAQKLRGFIGKPVSHLTRRRPDARTVCEPGCMKTQDFRPDRLTVTYDTRSRRIKRMRCE